MQLSRDAAYHVMSRGHNREALFAQPDDCHAFLSLLARYRLRFGVRLYHYCLMTNHLHLLLRTPRPNLGRGMQRFFAAYAHCSLRRRGRLGHLFQGGYRSELIEHESDYRTGSRYIGSGRLGGAPGTAVYDPSG